MVRGTDGAAGGELLRPRNSDGDSGAGLLDRAASRSTVWFHVGYVLGTGLGIAIRAGHRLVVRRKA